MPSSKITPVPFETVGQLLTSGHLLDIPLNQRALEWDFSKMQSVWNDLREIAENPLLEHFMGFMVFQSAGTKQKPVYVVQDGQQRLMCLVSITGILYRLLLERDPSKSASQQASLANLFQTHNRPRLKLDSHHEHLSALLNQGIAGQPLGKERKSAAKFQKAFHELERTIRAELSSLSDEQLRDWASSYIIALHDRALLMAVSVTSPALALKIFYRLNVGGVALSASDIAKNLAYLAAERQHVPEREVTDRWERLVELVPFSSLSDFLRYWAEMQDEAMLKKKGSLDLALQEHCGNDVVAYLDKLVKSAQSLHDWWNESQGISIPVGEALRLLGRPALAYPLLWVADELLSDGVITLADRDAIAKAVECYIFRELTVGKRKTNEIRAHLILSATELRTNGATAAIGVLSAKSPDSVFQQAFETWVTRTKTKQFYVLREIERRLSEGQPTPGASYSWTDDKKTRAWEIEHICPIAKKAVLTVEVNRIGNLVLLEKALNRACKDKDFAGKRIIYRSGRTGPRPLHGSKMSAVVGGNYPTGIVYTALVAMSKIPLFGDKQIQARQKELAAVAVQQWKIS